jgi:hypothetical protein
MADTNRASVAPNDRKDFDRPTLIRVGAWGLGAFVSLGLMVYAAQTELGTKRAAAAVAAIMSPPRDAGMTVAQVMARTAESEREARRMSEIVRSLSSERDRLTLRVDSVEREMDGLTGSIKAQQAKPAQSDGKAPAPVAPPVISAPSVTPIIKHAVVPPPPMAPQHAEVASVSSATAATSAMLPGVPPPVIDPHTSQAIWPRPGSLFTPPATLAAATPAPAPAQPVASSPAASPSTPEEVLATMVTPPDMPPEIPLPRPSPLALLQATAMQTYAPSATPEPSAAPASAVLPSAEISKSDKIAPAASTPATPDTTGSVPENNEPQPKVEIGVDLGPALTMSRLRSRWEAFKKFQGAVAETVRPVVSIREISPGKPVELRLVVGPLADVAVAAKLCVALSGSQFPCQPAVFDGQRLALQ